MNDTLAQIRTKHCVPQVKMTVKNIIIIVLYGSELRGHSLNTYVRLLTVRDTNSQRIYHYAKSLYHIISLSKQLKFL